MPLERIRKAGGGTLALLSLCFVAGAAFGQVLALAAPDAAASELRQILSDYYQNRQNAQVGLSAALFTLFAWFRAPVLAFLCGFTPLGVPLVCLTAAAFGLLPSFSLGCFAAAFGWRGVALCASAMGFRALVTLPCFFLLALSSVERAAWLFRVSTGRARRGEARPKRRRRAALCALVLLAGAALDLYGTPRLLRLTLDWLAAFPRTGLS